MQEILIWIFAHTQSFCQNFWDWGLTPRISGPLCPFHILLLDNLTSMLSFSDSPANFFWISQDFLTLRVESAEEKHFYQDRLTPCNTFTERVKWVTAGQARPLIVPIPTIFSWNAPVHRACQTLHVSCKLSWAAEALTGCSTAVTDVFQSHWGQCTLLGWVVWKRG